MYVHFNYAMERMERNEKRHKLRFAKLAPKGEILQVQEEIIKVIGYDKY